MAAAAHNPQFAKQVGIPQKVAVDFNQADTGTKMLSRAMKGNHPGKNLGKFLHPKGGKKGR